MTKFDRVRVGRRKQIAAYAAREARRAFTAYEADFLEKVRAEEEAEFGPGLEFGPAAAAGGGGPGQQQQREREGGDVSAADAAGGPTLYLAPHSLQLGKSNLKSK